MNPTSPDRRVDWALALLAIAGTAAVLAALGWVGPDIDVWYGAGLVRAINERPLAPESLGHVPKLAHLAVLAPAAALGPTPERWLLLVGIASLLLLLWSHARWARATALSSPRLILALAVAPLLWRATLDGGSVAWGWSCVLAALASRASGRRGAPAWLALAALFRPECVGVGLALGIRGRHLRERGAWWLAGAPLVAGTLGTVLVDLLWSGSFGASSIAHGVFESVALERIRGRWGFADTAHPWLQLSLPLLISAAVALSLRSRRADEERGEGDAALRDLATAAVGFSVVTIANVATGGTPFVRFLLPWVSVMAALAATIPWPLSIWRWVVALGAVVTLSVLGWQGASSEFVGTYPTSESLLVARNVARATDPELVVAMDAGARAVSLGSGARRWNATPWVLQSAETPCRSQMIIARGALIARMDSVKLERCGPWRDVVVDSAQLRVNLRVLLAKRDGSLPR